MTACTAVGRGMGPLCPKRIYPTQSVRRLPLSGRQEDRAGPRRVQTSIDVRRRQAARRPPTAGWHSTRRPSRKRGEDFFDGFQLVAGGGGGDEDRGREAG